MSWQNTNGINPNNGYIYPYGATYSPYSTPQQVNYYPSQCISSFSGYQHCLPQSGYISSSYSLNNGLHAFPQNNMNYPFTSHGYQMENRYIENNMSIEPQLLIKEYTCNCTKSNCMNQYCSCLKNGAACGVKCRCTGCRNKKNQKIVRPLKTPEQIVTCNCRRSKCVKKYCDCFASGKKCSKNCGCIDCKN